MIRIENFHKTYGETVAVQGLSFEVAPGTILGLVGPNGAGKTTTLRALAGIIPATRGKLGVAGYDLTQDSVAAKREIAYIPDEPKLFDALTVWEHLEFIAAAYRVPDFEKKATELLEEFELIDKQNTPAQQLSRGMRQKVAISCAYLHSPRAVLFDEPLNGLDPRAIRTLKDTVRARAADGAAVIISSHLLALVQDLCSLLLILNHGKCLFFGPIQEARTRFEDLSSDASLEEVFFRVTED